MYVFGNQKNFYYIMNKKLTNSQIKFLKWTLNWVTLCVIWPYDRIVYDYGINTVNSGLSISSTLFRDQIERSLKTNTDRFGPFSTIILNRILHKEIITVKGSLTSLGSVADIPIDHNFKAE